MKVMGTVNDTATARPACLPGLKRGSWYTARAVSSSKPEPKPLVTFTSDTSPWGVTVKLTKMRPSTRLRSARGGYFTAC